MVSLSSWPIPAGTTCWPYKLVAHNSGDRDGYEKRFLNTSPSPKNICAAQGSGKKADWCGIKGTNPSKPATPKIMLSDGSAATAAKNRREPGIAVRARPIDSDLKDRVDAGQELLFRGGAGRCR
jgi:hypothetical protein